MSAEQVEMWEWKDSVERVMDYHDTEIARLVQRYPREQTTITFDWADIHTVSADLANEIEKDPRSKTNVFKKVLCETVPQEGLKDRVDDNGDVVRGELVDIRFKNVGDTLDVTDVNERGDELVDQLVTVRGQVTKTTPTKPRVTLAAFQCQACGTMMYVDQPTHGVNKPDGCDLDCNAGIEPRLAESETVKHQLVRVKHPPGEVETDIHIDVHLTRDDAGSVSSGDSVDITGVLREDFGDFDVPIPEFYLEGHNVRKHQSDYEDIDIVEHKEKIKEIANGEHGTPYDLLVDSIAPSITGGERMDRIKLALAMQLFGGWRIEKKDGTAFRGDLHTLMVGPPGTGKSDILDSIESISPRVSRVSGKNASKVGLTAAAVEDSFGDTQWSIEAGAFVKGHKGVCIIDELDKVDGDALSSLHSALEKQRLNVSKAGQNTTLSCETALLGAANPTEERFLPQDVESYVEQIPLGEALRSRMDAIFLIMDEPDEAHDKDVVRNILHSIASGENVQTTTGEYDESVDPALSHEIVRSWVAFARQQCFPTFDLELMYEQISERYVKLRQDSAQSGAPITPRKVAAAIRYSVASARIRLADRITIQDIDRALAIIGASLGQVGLTKDGVPTQDPEKARRHNFQLTRKQKEKKIAEAADKSTLEEIAEDTGIDLEEVETLITRRKGMLDSGSIYEPQQGVYQST